MCRRVRGHFASQQPLGFGFAALRYRISVKRNGRRNLDVRSICIAAATKNRPGGHIGARRRGIAFPRPKSQDGGHGL